MYVRISKYGRKYSYSLSIKITLLSELYPAILFMLVFLSNTWKNYSYCILTYIRYMKYSYLVCISRWIFQKFVAEYILQWNSLLILPCHSDICYQSHTSGPLWLPRYVLLSQQVWVQGYRTNFPRSLFSPLASLSKRTFYISDSSFAL